MCPRGRLPTSPKRSRVLPRPSSQPRAELLTRGWSGAKGRGSSRRWKPGSSQDDLTLLLVGLCVGCRLGVQLVLCHFLLRRCWFQERGRVGDSNGAYLGSFLHKGVSSLGCGVYLLVSSGLTLSLPLSWVGLVFLGWIWVSRWCLERAHPSHWSQSTFFSTLLSGNLNNYRKLKAGKHHLSRSHWKHVC